MDKLSSLGLLAVVFLLVPKGVELMAVLWGGANMLMLVRFGTVVAAGYAAQDKKS